MKVLLLSPPYVPHYMRNARCDFVSLSATQWYPLLLGYCGVWLEKNGHEVRLLDAPAEGLTHGETEKIVQAFRPDWIVLYTGRLSEENDLDFGAKLVDGLGCQAVIVGPFASIDPGKTLKKARNIGRLVVGEFEKPVQELVDGRTDGEIGNLFYKDGDVIKENPTRPYLGRTELDAFPFVSRFFKEHVNLRRYKTVSEPYPFMDILTGRGCHWGRCTYCLWVHSYIKGPAYNSRSAESVVEEIQFIESEMPEIQSIMIQDDTLIEERIEELCEAMLRAGVRLKWSCYVRANISRPGLDLMKRANCLNVHVGFESASPQILGRIKKGLTPDRMTAFVKDAKNAGIRIHGDFALGFPGETRETAQETIDWACRIRPHTAQFQLMIPFPGTGFHRELETNSWLDGGRPNYPAISADELESMAKKAYRKFYLSAPFFGEMLRHPRELLFSRFGVYLRALPSMFWKKYER